uniref:Ribosomal protein n=1 Tax=Angiostrongylus cantonensis TaxID=6313 RepID=A0A0K0D635_ANGCA
MYAHLHLAKTTRRRLPFNAIYDTGEELLPGACDSKGVGGVGVPVNTSLVMKTNLFEQPTTKIRHLRLKGNGPISALTMFVICASALNYDKGVDAFHMDWEKFYTKEKKRRS